MIEDVKQLAVEAGQKIMEVREQALQSVDFKADASPVTAADLASNDIIVAGLEKLGNAPVISEEGIQHAPGDRFWLVDPLDGTKDFVAGKPTFIVNISLIESGVPTLGVLYAPVTQELFWAQMGSGAYKQSPAQEVIQIMNSNRGGRVRVVASGSHMSPRMQEFLDSLPMESLKRYGSALKMCRVAEGVADLYPRMGPTHEWDTAAAHIVLNEAGCKLIDVATGEALAYGKPGLKNSSFVASRADIDVLPALRKLRERYLQEMGHE